MATPDDSGGKKKLFKNKTVLIGAGVVGLIVFYMYYQRQKANVAAASAAANTSAVDPNAIDPSTGLSYGAESGYTQDLSGYSIPNPYVGQTGSVTTGGTAGYTSNTAWLADAENYATSYFNASLVLTGSALSKYFAQTPGGLNPDEYQLISEIVGLIGPPPQGTFRLIQNTGGQNPSSPAGGNSNEHLQGPQYATLVKGISLRTYARWNGSNLSVLLQLNPSLTADETNHPTVTIQTSQAHMVPN